MWGRNKIVFATAVVLGMAIYFDFFGVRALPAEPPANEAAKHVIPEENLEIPEQMQACAANLREIYAAIKKYEKGKGKLPDWLSDLVPDYLSSEKLFCPNDARHRSPFSPDPRRPCSYGWEFSSARIPSGWDPTRRTLFRDWKTQQVKLFGDVVPMVRCHHHGSNRVLNLSAGGEIWLGPLNWEYMFRPDYDSIHKQTLSRAIASRRAKPEQSSSFVGKTAPPFTLKDLNGKQVSLSDFKGKVVLLDFWATWCGPCRRVIPHLEALHKKYKEQGLVIIGMNNERNHDKVRAFAKEQMSYIVLLDADEQFKAYGIRGIPAAFYIDREGRIRYREVGYGPGAEIEVERKVNELLTIREGVTAQSSELDRLIDQLKHTDHRIRRSAAEALAKLDWQPVTDQQRAYYFLALQKWTELVKLGPSAVEPLLVALKAIARRREDDAVRRSARDALTKIGPLAVEPAITALKDKDARLHSSAALALGLLHDKRAVEPLIAALKDNDARVRQFAALSLRRLGDNRAVEPLIASLMDENRSVRSYSADALGELGDKRAVEPLIAAMKDEDRSIQKSASLALSHFADKDSADRFVELLDDTDMKVRALAVDALARM
ncbi:MAG: HEAT repeat domain-containing protein, partial [Planctomycetota bacterium]